MTLEVVDADEGHVERPGDRLGVGQAHQQRADQTRPGGHRDRAHVGKARAGRLEDLVEGGVQPAQVGPRRQLGHDPAGAGMQGDLARDGLGDDAARSVEEGHARLVAGRLDGEQKPAGHPGASGSGRAAISARRVARRVTIAGLSNGSVVMIRASS